ncbi:hypothetical protein FQN50_008633 [Emmonsiellopsis sp. PD_5]|nr:hypothetical protein FQN50_008633 [Emmonsiellopsis sp. PD_5]
MSLASGQQQSDWEPLSSSASTLYRDQQEPSPSILLVLLLTAHPELKLNHCAMANVSHAMPDPRMWTTVSDLQRLLSPLVELSNKLRDLPLETEEEDSDDGKDEDDELDPFAEDVNPESGVWIGQSLLRERRLRAKKVREERMKRAWAKYAMVNGDAASEDGDFTVPGAPAPVTLNDLLRIDDDDNVSTAAVDGYDNDDDDEGDDENISCVADDGEGVWERDSQRCNF